MSKTIIGIIVATVVLYLWGFLFWGVSTLPYAAWKQVANDEQTQEMLRQNFPESGTYFIPGMNHDADELVGLYEKGPVGFVHISLAGRSQTDLTVMIGGLLLNLIVVALMAGMFRVAGAKEFRDFARLSLAAGAVAVVAIDGGDLIWWQIPVEWKVWQAIYDFSLWIVAGHILGIFMKQQAEQAS